MKPTCHLARRAAGLAAIAALLALAAGCATVPDVRTDQAPGSNLQAYRTFAFHEPAGSTYMTLIEQRVREATREQLERRHYTYDERSPDLRVNDALHVVDRQQLQAAPQGLRYRPWAAAGIVGEMFARFPGPR